MITEEHVTAEWNGLVGVWSVGIMLDPTTFAPIDRDLEHCSVVPNLWIGLSVAEEDQINEAKKAVLARCAEISKITTATITDEQIRKLFEDPFITVGVANQCRIALGWIFSKQDPAEIAAARARCVDIINARKENDHGH